SCPCRCGRPGRPWRRRATSRKRGRSGAFRLCEARCRRGSAWRLFGGGAPVAQEGKRIAEWPAARPFHGDASPASMRVWRGKVDLQVAVIVNPAAGGGRMGRVWPAAQAALSRRLAPLHVAVTQGPGDGRRLAAEFTRRGMELIV